MKKSLFLIILMSSFQLYSSEAINLKCSDIKGIGAKNARINCSILQELYTTFGISYEYGCYAKNLDLFDNKDPNKFLGYGKTILQAKKDFVKKFNLTYYLNELEFSCKKYVNKSSDVFECFIGSDKSDLFYGIGKESSRKKARQAAQKDCIKRQTKSIQNFNESAKASGYNHTYSNPSEKAKSLCVPQKKTTCKKITK